MDYIPKKGQVYTALQSTSGPLLLCYLLKVYVVQQEKVGCEMGGGGEKV